MSTPSKRPRATDEAPCTPTPVKRCRSVSSPGPSPQRVRGVSLRDLSESLSSDVASRMAEEVQSTQGDPLPGDLNDRHADLAARALANVLLLAAKGSHTLATDIWENVNRRVLGEGPGSITDTVIVDGIQDALHLLRDNTGPQGVTCRDVVLAACVPKTKPLGDDAPRAVKPKDFRTHSLQAIADRLGVDVSRMHSGASRRAHWISREPNPLYTYSPEFTVPDPPAYLVCRPLVPVGI